MEENEKLDKKEQNINKNDVNQEKENNKIITYINIISKSVMNVIYILLCIIVIILIYNLIQITVLGKPYMNLFGYSLFQVKTGSMSGTIEIGDIVVVKLTKDVEVNDIITYEQEQMLITHRVIDKQAQSITTKGDANNAKDKPIENEKVIGKVVYTIKNVEIWKNVLKTPEVYISIIITFILFGITSMVGKQKKE
ncbi:MAG: signal peptidase I [Clostridia bacterium]|nr:signal peptidase I [Clostridia bacterium]